MNKRIRLLTVLLLAAMLLLSACSEAYPLPSEQTAEPSPNHTGLRFCFTLPQFCDKAEQARAARKDAAFFSLRPGDWAILAQELVDDSGVEYMSYFSRRGELTFTAAVENESGRLMNVGCGCRAAQLEERDGRERYIAAASVLAQAAGGFTADDISFLRRLIGDLLDGGEDELFYEGLRYTRSKEALTVMVILSPCSAESAERDGVKIFGSQDN